MQLLPGDNEVTVLPVYFHVCRELTVNSRHPEDWPQGSHVTQRSRSRVGVSNSPCSSQSWLRLRGVGYPASHCSARQVQITQVHRLPPYPVFLGGNHTGHIILAHFILSEEEESSQVEGTKTATISCGQGVCPGTAHLSQIPVK